mmetsp:Transcript_100422/g.216564  ORF Transcript_100422/g.216564 Transcript_100422/m.216564 type:complete len:206 (+) Transcript_100422:789-1406(+)
MAATQESMLWNNFLRTISFLIWLVPPPSLDSWTDTTAPLPPLIGPFLDSFFLALAAALSALALRLASMRAICASESPSREGSLGSRELLPSSFTWLELSSPDWEEAAFWIFSTAVARLIFLEARYISTPSMYANLLILSYAKRTGSPHLDTSVYCNSGSLQSPLRTAMRSHAALVAASEAVVIMLSAIRAWVESRPWELEDRGPC